MNESFFFALLRISIAQILKGSGFDKCKPLILNVVTDLYIKYLALLLSKAQKYATARTHCTNVIEVQDVLQALLETQLIKPLSGESILDPHDLPEPPQPEYNVKSLESFIGWLKYSDQFKLSKRLSDVPNSMIRTLMEKRKIDTSDETDQEKKKRRLKEKQEYYNQLKQTSDGPSNDQVNGLVDEVDEDEVTANDKLSWLAYMAEKDTKLGHNLQHANTLLQDTVLPVQKNQKFHPIPKDGLDHYTAFLHHMHTLTKNDHILLASLENDPNAEENEDAVLPSETLKEALPYNIKYSDSLTSEDLDQYLSYVSKHGYPVLPPPTSSSRESSVEIRQNGEDVDMEAPAEPPKDETKETEVKENEEKEESVEKLDEKADSDDAEKSGDEKPEQPEDSKEQDAAQKETAEEKAESVEQEGQPTEPSDKPTEEPSEDKQSEDKPLEEPSEEQPTEEKAENELKDADVETSEQDKKED